MFPINATAIRRYYHPSHIHIHYDNIPEGTFLRYLSLWTEFQSPKIAATCIFRPKANAPAYHSYRCAPFRLCRRCRAPKPAPPSYRWTGCFRSLCSASARICDDISAAEGSTTWGWATMGRWVSIGPQLSPWNHCATFAVASLVHSMRSRCSASFRSSPQNCSLSGIKTPAVKTLLFHNLITIFLRTDLICNSHEIHI